MSYIFAGRVPESVTYWATPYRNMTRDLQGAIFAQEQWIIERLTLNLGLRLEGVRGMCQQTWLRGHGCGARFRRGQERAELEGLRSARRAAFDLFGTGGTAVKGSLGRFIPIQSNIPIGTTSGIVFPNNPVSAIVISSTRTWTDNGDYIPQESELGPHSAVISASRAS